MLTDWVTNAQSIWGTGFEGWRESTEVRPLNDDQLGRALGYGELEAVKGAGRMSILLFTFAYMFLEFKNVVPQEEMEEFKK